MTPFLLLAALGGLTIAVPAHGIRDRFLRALVLFGVALVVITESLGVLSLIRYTPLVLCWSAVLLLALACAAKRPSGLRIALPSLSADPVVLLSTAGILIILALTSVTAAFSPPNSADAMAYHMPRVVYWAEQASVRFFPTQYLNQIMLQPLAEYLMLHTYVLSGGDLRFGQTVSRPRSCLRQLLLLLRVCRHELRNLGVVENKRNLGGMRGAHFALERRRFPGEQIHVDGSGMLCSLSFGQSNGVAPHSAIGAAKK